MSRQVSYYNQFAELHRQSILDCPEPHFWTTDYDQQGPVYHEMKPRVEKQRELVEKFFSPGKEILDIGCGFGRQATWLLGSGYSVTGIDSSAAFIDIANALAEKKGAGVFICSSLDDFQPGLLYSQVLLLDVLEHFPPGQRIDVFKKLNDLMPGGGFLLISVPIVRKRLSSRINNRFIRRLKGLIPYFVQREEHPYMIPVRNDILRLAGRNFELVEETTSGTTAFFVLRKIA
jgi:2-polyprenyl-3-methyl-5-hydroxy-6-metoxy-1,4-benzoquinol methylase